MAPRLHDRPHQEETMHAIGERRRTNAWGSFYVTDECDGCGICMGYAPENFAQSWDGTYYAIVQQPESKDEVRAVRRGELHHEQPAAARGHGHRVRALRPVWSDRGGDDRAAWRQCGVAGQRSDSLQPHAACPRDRGHHGEAAGLVHLVHRPARSFRPQAADHE